MADLPRWMQVTFDKCEGSEPSDVEMYGLLDVIEDGETKTAKLLGAAPSGLYLIHLSRSYLGSGKTQHEVRRWSRPLSTITGISGSWTSVSDEFGDRELYQQELRLEGEGDLGPLTFPIDLKLAAVEEEQLFAETVARLKTSGSP